MWQLYIPTSLPEASADSNISILVGQRSCVYSSKEESCTVCVLAGYVPCNDPSVVEEQIECLKQVLPFGIEVLGLSGDTAALASLAVQVPDLKGKELVEAVMHNGTEHRQPVCRIFGAPQKKVQVVSSEISFVEARFAVHSYDRSAPLLLSCSNAPPHVVDGESGAPLMEHAPSASSRIELVQTGAVPSTLRIHVVVAPSLTSARGLYETLFRQLKAASKARTTRLIELNAHNAHLSYCCRLECRADAPAGTDTFTEDEWMEVLEMMEDATGQRVLRGDVRSVKPLLKSCQESGASATKAAKKSPAQLPLYLLLGVVVVLMAVVLMR
ncbi:hypothetical protein LSCM1_03371 [Leishmania martiniquensis]|uniref:Protein odr-4 homolog n=1 Tax=Leishmania martiniquensis TaxID=1580590 RepID=A0A836H0E3_9TRYP|nr:hypothetical protein LSCM1_03371 [Leishmania martiniquensis]